VIQAVDAETIGDAIDALIRSAQVRYGDMGSKRRQPIVGSKEKPPPKRGKSHSKPGTKGSTVCCIPHDQIFNRLLAPPQ
jgi:hypothetical protein